MNGGGYVGTGRLRRRIPFWLCVIAAVAAAALFAVAIAGWGHGRGGATLRAMSASEQMSDTQARAVADNTIRAFSREIAASNVANIEALSCPNPTPHGMLATTINDVKRHAPFLYNKHLATTSSFHRHGPVWLLDAFYTDGGGFVFELHINDGELRVCQIGSAPVP